jgi:small subunit ribosomal protein S6
MTKAAEYELVLMLDPEIPDAERDRISAEARQRIESSGNLKHDSAWGMRKLAYEIRQRTEADYRFFRFESQGSLLEDLDHNLKIADGVLRFRIFKVDPRSPLIVPPSPSPTSAPPPRRDRRSPDSRGDEAAPPPPAAPAPEADAAPEAPTEPEADAAPEAPPQPEAATDAPEAEPAPQAEPAPLAEPEGEVAEAPEAPDAGDGGSADA